LIPSTRGAYNRRQADDVPSELTMPTDVERRPGWLDRLKLRVKKMLGMKTILCDTCKWDWRSACHHTERPNATWCADYEKRGT
jgi:hypothetical protein